IVWNGKSLIGMMRKLILTLTDTTFLPGNQKPLKVTAGLLVSFIDDERSRNLGFGPLLPLRESDGPTLFCFHPASGFAWQFSVLSR
ncbi:thioesterase, partial [Salmonella enterica subsp. enterica serovar Anatum]|nr:thioesterase [Salmonella enterica subsp. enterica serovar Anatum]